MFLLHPPQKRKRFSLRTVTAFGTPTAFGKCEQEGSRCSLRWDGGSQFGNRCLVVPRLGIANPIAPSVRIRIRFACYFQGPIALFLVGSAYGPVVECGQ